MQYLLSISYASTPPELRHDLNTLLLRLALIYKQFNLQMNRQILVIVFGEGLNN